MIKITNAIKKYGDFAAINDLSLHIEEKKIYCLLGRNGAGKTTLMNLISGKHPATSGEVLVKGERVTSINMPACITYIEPTKSQFNLKVRELMKLAAELSDEFDYEFAEKMIAKFRIDKEKKYQKLSLGSKVIVTTLISIGSNSEIVLLDEPTLGFDPIMRNEFYNLLHESYTHHPRVIIVSTHMVEEISKVVDEVIIIDSGKLVFRKEISELDKTAYMVTGQKDLVLLAIRGLNVLSIEEKGTNTTAYVLDKRIKSDALEVHKMSLQDLFIRLVGGQS